MDSTENGTFLQNVTRVELLDGATIPITGAYMWPNGWVTVYDTDNQNQGRIIPPDAVRQIWFGKESE